MIRIRLKLKFLRIIRFIRFSSNLLIYFNLSKRDLEIYDDYDKDIRLLLANYFKKRKIPLDDMIYVFFAAQLSSFLRLDHEKHKLDVEDLVAFISPDDILQNKRG